MKANTQYNDLQGTVAADFSDLIGISQAELQTIGLHFGIDIDRFQVVTFSLYREYGSCFSIHFECIEKETGEKVHEEGNAAQYDDTEILNFLFKRLHIVFH